MSYKLKKAISLLLVLVTVFSVVFSFASCESGSGEISGKKNKKSQKSESSEESVTEKNDLFSSGIGDDTESMEDETDDPGTGDKESTENKITAEPAAEREFKLGVILLHDEFSAYDKAFIDGIKEAKKALGLKQSQIVVKKNVPESEKCYDAAIELVAAGCNVIFANSFGHENYLIMAAKEHKDVQFCHVSGFMAHTEKLANFHNVFASIYEGRYLAGVAAGLKLKEMDAAGKITEANRDANGKVKIGYVGAFTYAEVISGYTSFFLGVRSEYENVSMMVQFTGSWYDEAEEKTAAQALLNNGCALISQHADSMGAPSACEDADVPNVAYNISNFESCPNTFIVSSRINWAPYFEYIYRQIQNDEEIAVDYIGNLSDGSVVLSAVNEKAAAAGTQERIDEVKAELVAGTRRVFDTSKFTLNGEYLTSYKADVDFDDDFSFTPDTEVISDGYFHESEKRGAPYFDIRIDDITLLNEIFA